MSFWKFSDISALVQPFGEAGSFDQRAFGRAERDDGGDGDKLPETALLAPPIQDAPTIAVDLLDGLFGVDGSDILLSPDDNPFGSRLSAADLTPASSATPVGPVPMPAMLKSTDAPDMADVASAGQDMAPASGASVTNANPANTSGSGFYYLRDGFGVSAEAAQDLIASYGLGSHQVRVAVADSKIDWNGTNNNNSSVLMDNRGSYFDFHPHNYNVTSSNYTHGTHVAGFVQYVAPDVKIDSYDIATGPRSGSGSAIVNAIRHAADRGVDVVNVSYSSMDSYGTGSSGYSAYQDAFNYAAARNTLVVFSAGNSNSEHTRTMNNVLIVGASTATGNKASFSSYGDNEVDVFAPGAAVSTMSVNGTSTATINGTSFSAPIVAGIAALLRSVDPNLSAAHVTEKIVKSAQKSSAMDGLSIADGIANAAAAFTVGTNGSEHILGGDGADRLNAYGGNDKVYTGKGNDIAWAHNGNDKLYGGDGNDRLYGGNNNDVLTGGRGNDSLYGQNHNDVLNGWGGDDKLYGGSGDDRLYGNQGRDNLYGEDGNDRLFASSGDDKLYGGGGNDLVNGGSGTDNMWGGSGRDTFEFKSGDLQDWDRISGSWAAKNARLDVIEDFTFGQDRILFNNFATVDSRSDLKAWRTVIDGDAHFTIQVRDTNERVLIDVGNSVSWSQVFNDNNFDFA